MSPLASSSVGKLLHVQDLESTIISLIIWHKVDHSVCLTSLIVLQIACIDNLNMWCGTIIDATIGFV